MRIEEAVAKPAAYQCWFGALRLLFGGPGGLFGGLPVPGGPGAA